MKYTLSSQERLVYRRYAELALPRHTSYPIAPVWKDDYGPDDFRSDLRQVAERNRPISLYIHIPFCEQLCYYCACTKEIIPSAKRLKTDPADNLMGGLEAEVGRMVEILAHNKVYQLHLGGGSPTFLNLHHLETLWKLLQRFRFGPAAEIAIEIDPRITTREQLVFLRQAGFNRISLGVQDFDPLVQKAVNRLQPFDQVREVVGWCRELGFSSINFDLIYGLPFQTLRTMARTLERTISLGPDRVAFYRLAVIPEIFRWQNTFRHADLPAGELTLDMNLLAINRFLAAGYEFIGLDHFAKPTELLNTARVEGGLQRNFQGMTTGKQLDLVGIGPSAISSLQEAFAQNQKSSVDWRKAVMEDFATARGLHLSTDDRLRQELLQQLYGHGVIDKSGLEKQFSIIFDDYFARELDPLKTLETEGLLNLDHQTITLTIPLGRLLVRVVAAVFDRYLPPATYREGLPETMASKVG